MDRGEKPRIAPHLMKGLAQRGAEIYHPPRPPVNPHIKTYAGRLATPERHIELRDPSHPELGNMLVDGPYPTGPPPMPVERDEENGTLGPFQPETDDDDED